MLNQNLKVLRKLNKLTQEQLAEKLMVSRQAVAKWERGDTIPDLFNLMALAKLYDVTLDNLVNHDDESAELSIAPKGKHMLGTLVIREDATVQIPVSALEMFHLEIGDELMLLADEEEGLALVEKQGFMKKMNEIMKNINAN